MNSHLQIRFRLFLDLDQNIIRMGDNNNLWVMLNLLLGSFFYIFNLAMIILGDQDLTYSPHLSDFVYLKVYPTDEKNIMSSWRSDNAIVFQFKYSNLDFRNLHPASKITHIAFINQYHLWNFAIKLIWC